MTTARRILLAAATLALTRLASGASKVELVTIESEHLKGTKTGVDPTRSAYVYLPPGYQESGRRYPVVYYFHSIFWSAKQMFADGSTQARLDRAIASGAMKELIFVAADYSTSQVGSLYENSPVSGRWLDFTAKELVPFVDRRFRTIAERDARGLAGEFVGGRGAFKMAMTFPELFSVVYAMHPLGTGAGLLPITSMPNWQRIKDARTFKDLDGESVSQVFVRMAQGFLPNPDRPPFFCDFPVDLANGAWTPDPDAVRKLANAYFLDRMTPEEAANLRRMRAVKLDWTRDDDAPSHVYSNQNFTRKLEELGVPHWAEEYGGGIWWRVNWIPGDGRFDAEVLPFLGKHLKFGPTAQASR